MESVSLARQRLRRYPEMMLNCSVPAAKYAKCVVNKDNVKHMECREEFELLRNCLKNAAKKAGTRL